MPESWHDLGTSMVHLRDHLVPSGIYLSILDTLTAVVRLALLTVSITPKQLESDEDNHLEL
ncbi:MAG: hypothetical protein VX709_16275 [Pseudomonadota bacterium]|nr:hypothetical protein [Pseudomonadota bacterium]